MSRSGLLIHRESVHWRCKPTGLVPPPILSQCWPRGWWDFELHPNPRPAVWKFSCVCWAFFMPYKHLLQPFRTTALKLWASQSWVRESPMSGDWPLPCSLTSASSTVYSPSSWDCHPPSLWPEPHSKLQYIWLGPGPHLAPVSSPLQELEPRPNTAFWRGFCNIWAQLPESWLPPA